MNQVNYITGNEGKLKTAQKFLEKYSIEVIQKRLDIKEIQSESIEEISIDKAQKAFQILKEPLFVNDTGWYIEALNGFPGPFMAFINKWLQTEDILSLMQNHTNRKITMRQVFTYKDKDSIKTFTHDVSGTVLTEIRGNTGNMVDRIISLSPNGLSISEEKDNGNFEFDFEKQIWSEFGEWLSKI